MLLHVYKPYIKKPTKSNTKLITKVNLENFIFLSFASRKRNINNPNRIHHAKKYCDFPHVLTLPEILISMGNECSHSSSNPSYLIWSLTQGERENSCASDSTKTLKNLFFYTFMFQFLRFLSPLTIVDNCLYLYYHLWKILMLRMCLTFWDKKQLNITCWLILLLVSTLLINIAI